MTANKSTKPKSATKLTSDVTKKEDGSISFKVTIPKSRVEEGYQQTLSAVAKTAEIKGFRAGKAPIKLVEENLGKQKLYTESLKHILPRIYAEAVRELDLTPISNPRVDPESLEENKDWRLKITVAQKPNIKLGNYKKAVSDALSSSKIWVPGKDKPAQESPQEEKQDKNQSTDEKLAKVFDTLLAEIKFALPEFLTEEEVNRELSRLVQQLEKLNVSIDQYLASLGKTSDQLREGYQKQASRTLKLELILNEIAEDMKIEVGDTEIDQLIKSVGDEKLRKSLSASSERVGIRTTLRKRKVIDALLRM